MSLKEFLESFEDNSSLMDLSGKEIGDEGAELVTLALEKTLSVLKVDLRSNAIGDEGAKALALMLEKNTVLRTVDLSSAHRGMNFWHPNMIKDVGANALAAALAKNVALLAFSLARNKIGPEGGKAFAVALQMNASLTSVDLSGNEIGSEGVKALMSALKKNTFLTTLNLSYNKSGDRGVRALAAALYINTSLTSVDLSGNKIGPEGVKSLAEALKNNTSVNTINLNRNKIGDEGAKALAAVLERSTSLTCVNLGGNKISLEGVRMWASALERNTSMMSCDLSENMICCKGAKVLAAALERNTSLTAFDLEDNEIGDGGAKSLAVALERNISLTCVNLSGSKIGDEGAKSLAAALEKNSFLTSFDMSSGEIGSKGAKALAAALEKNSSLTSLDLGLIRVGTQGNLTIENLAFAAALGKNTVITNILFHCVGFEDNLPLAASKQALAVGLEKNRHIRACLIHSVASGQSDIVEAVCRIGVDVASLTDEGLTVLHLALDFNQWKCLETLLRHRNCKGLLRIPIKSGRKSAIDEIRAKLELCSEPLRRKIHALLEKSDYCTSMSKSIFSMRSDHQLLSQKWHVLKDLLIHPACLEARGRTMTAVSGLQQQNVLESIDQLERLEASFVQCSSSFQTRQTQREELMELLFEQMQAVAAFIVASTSEVEVLSSLAFSSAVPSDNFELISSTQLMFEEFQASVDEIRRNEQTIKNKVVHVHQEWSLEGAMLLESVVASAREEMEEILAKTPSAKEIEPMIERCRLVVNYQYAQRLQYIQEQQVDIVQFFHKLDAKHIELKRALDAGKQIESVQANVTEARKKLERSKRDLSQSEAKLKNAIEDLEDGDGSEERVTKAQQKLNEARERMSQCRIQYEAAVASLIDIRQAGYPELHCAAAAKNDRFPNVPTISFNELGEVEKIGGGTFADVFKVELPVTGPCAFKQLRGNIGQDALMKEAAAMWELRHSEHVIRLLKVCTEPGHQGLLLELADGGSLGDLLHAREETLTEAEMLQILHDVASGLECVHQHNHVHLDVKGDNVLLTSSRRAKLADFGASKQARNTYRDTKVALTFQWSAPEMLIAMPKISSACDIWSFGMLIYETLAGKVPFANVEMHKLAQTITSGTLPNVPSTIKRSFSDLMYKCWQVDPNLRPTASELLSEIGSLMTRQCCGPCGTLIVLSKGLLCSRAASFLCFACLPEALESQLRSRSNLRSDGALAIGRETLFELHSVRSIVNKGLLSSWLKAQQEAKEAEVRQRLDAELEREKRKWEQMSASERIANSIRWDVLPCRCPKCKERLYYSGGCFSLTCEACKSPFCAFCEHIFKTGVESHDHVPHCKLNTLKVPWFPDANEQQATFARVQKVRQVRDEEEIGHVGREHERRGARENQGRAGESQY
jgi:serine/threonine protein kinase/Ran GTPase-activating protein (RanGAP) involved in mRNA processing and transport